MFIHYCAYLFWSSKHTNICLGIFWRFVLFCFVFHSTRISLFLRFKIIKKNTEATLSEPEILQQEVQTAISHLKESKAPTQVTFKQNPSNYLMKEQSRSITQLFNNIYDAENFHKDV